MLLRQVQRRSEFQASSVTFGVCFPNCGAQQAVHCPIVKSASVNAIPEWKAEAEYTQFRQAADRVPVMFLRKHGICLDPATQQMRCGVNCSIFRSRPCPASRWSPESSGPVQSLLPHLRSVSHTGSRTSFLRVRGFSPEHSVLR